MAQKTLSSDEMMAAILSYLGILFLIPLLAIKQRNEFIKFHLSQGIVLFIAAIILYVGFWILAFIPFLGWLIGIVIYNLLGLLLLIVVIVAIVKAVQGEMWEIPVIGAFRSKIAL